MSKNVKVNDTIYSGVSVVQLPLSDGSGTVPFKDVDEISEPSGSKTITTNGTHDVKNYANAVVNVPTGGGGITPSGTKQITENGEHDVTSYAKVNVQVAGGGGYSIEDLATGAPEGEIVIMADKIEEGAFSRKNKITKVTIKGSGGSARYIAGHAFSYCTKLKEVILENAPNIFGYGFGYCTALEKVTFTANQNIPANLTASAFGSCTALTDIYVPWAEGEVANAPWGADKATVHYNS